MDSWLYSLVETLMQLWACLSLIVVTVVFLDTNFPQQMIPSLQRSFHYWKSVLNHLKFLKYK